MIKRNIIRALSLLALSLLCRCVFAQDEMPVIGTIKTLQATACRLDESSNRRSSLNSIYTPPAGWQIVTFKPVVIAKTAGASYRFSLTSTNFQYKSTSAIYSKFIQLLELAAEKNVFQKYERQIHEMRSDFEKYLDKKAPACAKITTTATAAKNNKNTGRKAALLHLDLQITLVYMPETEEEMLQSLEYMKQVIDGEG